ncbi:hypothetical protein [Polynucleobacter sp. JS-Safj-400b-B2]|uniref:hypothetical protein n=1 Tax=Polynucleobacter sp. JS-Safj-400b-B2 TaxID=2576921 RepID=UPI001C0AA884|nr:hypothetical protein [Polynucleobacter sp. JS-Safj-400b-B2]
MKLQGLVYSVDFWTVAIGVIGFLMISIGIALVYFPAGLIVAGIMLNAWSFVVARSVARSRN